MDVENFDRIQKMHPHFPELIAAFKDEPEAYDSFITIVSFFLLKSALICAYIDISIRFSARPRYGRSQSSGHKPTPLRNSKIHPP